MRQEWRGQEQEAEEEDEAEQQEEEEMEEAEEDDADDDDDVEFDLGLLKKRLCKMRSAKDRRHIVRFLASVVIAAKQAGWTYKHEDKQRDELTESVLRNPAGRKKRLKALVDRFGVAVAQLGRSGLLRAFPASSLPCASRYDHSGRGFFHAKGADSWKLKHHKPRSDEESRAHWALWQACCAPLLLCLAAMHKGSANRGKAAGVRHIYKGLRHTPLRSELATLREAAKLSPLPEDDTEAATMLHKELHDYIHTGLSPKQRDGAVPDWLSCYFGGLLGIVWLLGDALPRSLCVLIFEIGADCRARDHQALLQHMTDTPGTYSARLSWQCVATPDGPLEIDMVIEAGGRGFREVRAES